MNFSIFHSLKKSKRIISNISSAVVELLSGQAGEITGLPFSQIPG